MSVDYPRKRVPPMCFVVTRRPEKQRCFEALPKLTDVDYSTCKRILVWRNTFDMLEPDAERHDLSHQYVWLGRRYMFPIAGLSD